MADLVITPTDVKLGSGRTKVFKSGVAGQQMNAGQTAFLDSTDNTFKLGDADLIANARVRGMCLNTAAQGQPVDILEEGEADIGAGVAGQTYWQSVTAGSIADVEPVGPGDFVTVVGIGRTGGKIFIKPVISEQVN